MFPYLWNVAVKEIQDQVVVSAVNENVVTNGIGLEISSLMQCIIEEADQTVFVHVEHALIEYARVMIKTVDSDIVVLAIASSNQLAPLNTLWIEFGARKSLRFIPIHQIAGNLGPDKYFEFVFFQAFSGCDTTSSLSGKGKISMDEITPLFRKSSIATPDEILGADYLSSSW